MRLIAKVISISRAKFHRSRLTAVQDIQDYASLVFLAHSVEQLELVTSTRSQVLETCLGASFWHGSFVTVFQVCLWYQKLASSQQLACKFLARNFQRLVSSTGRNMCYGYNVDVTDIRITDVVVGILLLKSSMSNFRERENLLKSKRVNECEPVCQWSAECSCVCRSGQ